MMYGIYLWLILVTGEPKPQIDSVYVLPHDSVVCRRDTLWVSNGEKIIQESWRDTIHVGNYWQHIVKRNGRWVYVSNSINGYF